MAMIGLKFLRGQAISQIAQFIGSVGLDEGVVGMDGRLENATLSIDQAFFFSGGYFGADAYGGVKAEQIRRRRRACARTGCLEARVR